ncbi:Hypothetical protein I595_337 [Croceitalea dokdonensis DOKDO 023]|uniref:Uncharacterized protein n=1 Tax=Croceitalea dokdonensis DOKDO 023 TaxID=1300341 RepID=A0A0P7AXC6_9FLAO|nr:Hypothetical protein I595_337 [Croceitalea dokdonensis DOKDO 023]
MLTQPKRNADFRAKRKALYLFIKSLNLINLVLDQKNKTKQQVLAWCSVENEKFSCLPYLP